MGRLMAAVGEGEEAPTAVYVTADLMAVGALHELKQCGYRVPADVSVVGTDNDPYAPFTDPPLTTVDVSRAESAALATRAVLELATGRDADPTTHLLDSRLLVRGSSGAPRDAGPA
jgi:DNA-binding LacI/PurR family transcriptional regulator